ncbi:hypothetical protein NXX53_00055 [Bacteroides salyersiae]|nr:hypothetical protein [Bacteroides salyersiae]
MLIFISQVATTSIITTVSLRESDGAQIGQNLDKSLLYDQWKQPGDITNVPRQDLNNSTYMSTRYLEDGSYMRLRNLTLAYTFPKSLLKPLKVENLRIFAQGLNLVHNYEFPWS